MKRFWNLLLVLFTVTVAFGQSSTPNIGLQIPATGSNNWYIPLNYNFTKLDLLLSGNLPIDSLNITHNVVIGGSVTAGSFVGVGGTGFATSPGAAQYAPAYFSAPGTGSVIGGASPFTGAAFYSTSAPPRALSTADVSTLLKTATGCTTTGYTYSPLTNTCVPSSGSGGGSPGGGNLSMQFKNSSAFGGTNFVTDATGSDLLLLRNFNSKKVLGTPQLSQYDTGSGDALANVMAGCTAGTNGCNVNIDPLTTSFNIPATPADNFLAISFRYRYLNNPFVFDISGNTAPAFSGQNYINSFANDSAEPPQFPTGPSLYSTERSELDSLNVPCFDYGDGGLGKCVYTKNFYSARWKGRGIKTLNSKDILCTGSGDCNYDTINFYDSMIHTKPGDEGSRDKYFAYRHAKDYVLTLSAPVDLATGNVAGTGGQNSGDWIGVDRPFVNTSRGQVSVNVTAQAAYGSSSLSLLTVSPSHGLASVFCGTLASGTPFQHTNSNNDFQITTITLPNATGSAYAIGTGFTVESGDGPADIARVLSTTSYSGGSQTVTAILQYPHEAGNVVCVDGAATGYYLTNNLIDDTSATGDAGRVLHLTQVYGAPDATHLIVGTSRQGNRDRYAQLGASTLYQGSTIADVRNPVTHIPDYNHIRVVPAASMASWDANDVVIGSSPASSTFVGMTFNTSLGAMPNVNGSLINIYAQGTTGYGGNGGGRFPVVEMFDNPDNYPYYGQHLSGGPYAPWAFSNLHGIPGALVVSAFALEGVNLNGDLACSLCYGDFHPGNLLGYYDVHRPGGTANHIRYWQHQDGGFQGYEIAAAGGLHVIGGDTSLVNLNVNNVNSTGVGSFLNGDGGVPSGEPREAARLSGIYGAAISFDRSNFGETTAAATLAQISGDLDGALKPEIAFKIGGYNYPLNLAYTVASIDYRGVFTSKGLNLGLCAATGGGCYNGGLKLYDDGTYLNSIDINGAAYRFRMAPGTTFRWATCNYDGGGCITNAELDQSGNFVIAGSGTFTTGSTIAGNVTLADSTDVPTFATEPTGSCSNNGAWAKGRDGSQAVCKAGTWVERFAPLP